MHIKPKKSLGQNFLADKNILSKMVSACAISGDDIVLEIGAGMGDLTQMLAQRAKEVYALEIDRRVFGALKQRLSAYPNCRLLEGDILKFDIARFARERSYNRKIKVIGNIPYYISTPIIEHLIRYRTVIDTVFMTVQKEFARRVVASAGSKEYGSLSCFVRYYAEGRIIFEIKKGSFKPSPKVDSCFLSLKFREIPAVDVFGEGPLFELIRAAFNQRRKTLRNALKSYLDGALLENFLKDKGIDRNVRAERLTLVEFADICNYMAARGALRKHLTVTKNK
ncbi:MAG: 16S rRNA (adenine(1518)-N(6)/adenine(1519)-N(6))-dimethyltransferase RsmA [Candidatus Omnitrophica bacterium]|nr:16S rRNA (adenine(1518)-N(6)/adenine(1519)-N(6))-dimethyltransferase RsmA [Candidatus Omnitrophota bacterium]MDD5771009.1 16S rRNA (adenine(1518)-N(6)/adenine(1519)-N(6))-dimethyltransferase RsmA [Candidatus Omnitrophota bacterium]